jgi:putative ABC transport system permease protein
MVSVSALDRKLLRDLWRMRGHLLAVALVAASGAATFVTMHGAYEALFQARAIYYRDYRFAEVFARLKRAPESLRPRIEGIPGVAAVATRVMHEATVDVAGFPDPVTGVLLSVPERGRPRLNDLHVRMGRYIVPGRDDEVLVNEAFALQHRLRPGDFVGAVINGRRQRLHIVGIANSPEFVYVLAGAAIFPDDKRYAVIWMGREALAAALDMTDAFNEVSIALSPGASERQVIDRLDVVLAPYGGTQAHGRADQVSHQMLEGEIEQDRVTGIVVPAIFLAVTAFLIHNVLARVVALQRPQIGVLKAFGFPDIVIAAHYAKLALAAVMLGCALGIGLGVYMGHGLAGLYQRFFRLPALDFALSAVTLGTVVTICAGAALAGAWPAVRRVLRMPPAEAMRPPAPATFRPLLVERFGYAHIFSPAARMVLRNLERRPLRALASVVAIALAAAVLIVGQFGMDAIDETVRVQFRAARRDDVRVAFSEPRGMRVRHELAALPGVLYVEPFRVAIVSVRHEHRADRMAIFGLPPRPELQRVLDMEMRELVLPPEGLVLSGGLARKLQATAGTVLDIRFFSGRRLSRRVPVVAVVEEPIGQWAYMDQRALARLMEEDVLASDAYLRVDPRELDRLYARLKALPGVSGIALREATLASFEATIAENLAISLGILIGFATMLAAGVVYNGARIALSEHATTLASLRVLGFRRREVTAILLGEQAVLTLLAIPCGLALGYGLAAWVAELLASELYRLPLDSLTHLSLYRLSQVFLRGNVGVVAA